MTAHQITTRLPSILGCWTTSRFDNNVIDITPMTNKPSAFLIMPFDEEFDAVHTGFIKPVLEGAGFSVDRADDIESQQNILRDVLEKIDHSNLIVADLTGANPNVFYELGLAHALKKPVILITQSIADVPFDLKSYRLLEYSTHFGRIGKAKELLTSYAEGFARGTIKFGSPVTDFYQDGTPPNHDINTVRSKTANEDDRGLLDHQIALNDGYNRIASLTVRATSDLQDLTKSLGTATKEFTSISANPNASSATAARAVSRRLAERVAHFNSQLKQANDEYANIAQDTEDSLEFVVSFQLEQSNLTGSAIDEQNTMLSSLQSLESVAVVARDSQLDLAAKMDTLPRLERRLNREVARASEETLVMAANLDKTIASISRVLKKYS